MHHGRRDFSEPRCRQRASLSEAQEEREVKIKKKTDRQTIKKKKKALKDDLSIKSDTNGARHLVQTPEPALSTLVTSNSSGTPLIKVSCVISLIFMVRASKIYFRPAETAFMVSRDGWHQAARPV